VQTCALPISRVGARVARLAIGCGKQAVFRTAPVSPSARAATRRLTFGTHAPPRRRGAEASARGAGFASHKPICAELREPSGAPGRAGGGIAGGDARRRLAQNETPAGEGGRRVGRGGAGRRQSSSPAISSA